MRKNILIAAFGLFLGSATFATAQLNDNGNNCCKSKQECCKKGAACCDGEKSGATSSLISNTSNASGEPEKCPMGCC